MKNREEMILKREDRLLKNEKSWRRARIGAIFLFIVFLLTILSIYGNDLISKDEKIKILMAIGGWCLFWLIIIDWLNLHLRHIDSIHFYRKNYMIR